MGAMPISYLPPGDLTPVVAHLPRFCHRCPSVTTAYRARPR
jgi:hypothetical protein